MDKTRITIILILTCIIIIGTTCLAATGVVNAPSGLVLRETASKSAKTLTTISDESKVEVIEKSGDWYKVKYGIYEGYLYAEFVNVQEEIKPENTSEEPKTTPEETKPEENTENAATNTEPNTEVSNYPRNVKTSGEVKAYILPSVSSKVIANIEAGKDITLNYELNNWFNILYNGKAYWIRKSNINKENGTAEENKDNSKQEEQKTENSNTEENKKGYIDVSSAANVRKSADASSEVLTTLLRNAEVTILGEEGDFYKIKYQNITGYVSKSLVSDKIVEVTSRRSNGERKTQESNETATANTKTTQEVKSTNTTKTTTTTTTNTNATKATQNTAKEQTNTQTTNTVEQAADTQVAGSGGEKVAAFAKKYIGYAYTYGGTTPGGGFDCTGFAYYVFNSCGYSLSRSCSVQSKSGTAVARENLKPGDLILFNNGDNGTIGHVAIYIGGGNIVHAENPRTGVVTSTINSGYYNKYYYSARRIAN